jgi:hypothetical protein
MGQMYHRMWFKKQKQKNNFNWLKKEKNNPSWLKNPLVLLFCMWLFMALIVVPIWKINKNKVIGGIINVMPAPYSEVMSVGHEIVKLREKAGLRN